MIERLSRLASPLVHRRRAPLVLVFFGLLVFAATRWFHPVPGIGNPDIGGILYSADTINLGLLPYRDTVDVKQPGSFFIVAAVFRISRRWRCRSPSWRGS